MNESVQDTMCERRKAVAITPLPLEIDLGRDAGAAARQAVEHPPPVIDDHAVAVGLAPVAMESRLRRGENEAEVLDGPRAQQRLPMRPSGRLREGGRDGEELCTGGAQPAKELWKPDVIAYGKTEPADRGLDDYECGAGRHIRRL